eukprot:Nitzschia sp. Nitz4//scaffold40_size135432//97745//98114//NITZ4_003259-RA/size135432-snap-gene-0.117-mRNA-1//1//CDS//3329551264//1012//frame0
MTYIARDGTVGGSKSITRTITDLIQGIIDFFALFFGAISNPPQRIESRASYAQRNNGRSYSGGDGGGRPGGNVRGMKNLQGNTTVRMGGG